MSANRPDKADDAGDGFQRAAAAAIAEAGYPRWVATSQHEQTRAIYGQLRQIDADHATAMAFNPGRPGRYRVAGENG
jgi:hypothetical protein